MLNQGCPICTTHLADLDIALIVQNFLSQNTKQEIFSLNANILFGFFDVRAKQVFVFAL